MTRYLVGRLIMTVAVLMGVATITFALIRLVPGDPARIILSEGHGSEEQYQELRRRLGLDEPIPTQYAAWIAALARGDLGRSLATGRPVAGDIVDRLPRTLELAAAATLTSIVLGVPAGILAATRRNTGIDHVISALVLVGLSLPRFVTATVLVLVLGVGLRVLPTSGFVNLADDPLGHLRVLALPTLSLTPLMLAVIARMTRSALLDVLGQDYLRTARAKGVAGGRVLWRHAIPNALSPVVTIVGLEIGTLLGGSIIVEAIFNWPGISSLLISAVDARDYPIIQSIVLMVAGSFVLLNLVVDLMNAALDPRMTRR